MYVHTSLNCKRVKNNMIAWIAGFFSEKNKNKKPPCKVSFLYASVLHTVKLCRDCLNRDFNLVPSEALKAAVTAHQQDSRVFRWYPCCSTDSLRCIRFSFIRKNAFIVLDVYIVHRLTFKLWFYCIYLHKDHKILYICLYYINT